MADSDSDSTPSHLEPSALGTKEYWDALYEKELSNHAENPRDEGTVWFDDADAEAKMVAYLLDHHAPSPSPSSVSAAASVLDLGCGNGSLLFALRDAGWRGRMLGVDYSERSVELARRVGASRRRAARRRRRRCGDDGDDGDGDEDEDSEEEEEEEDKDDDDDNNDGTEWEEVEFKVWDVLKGPLADVAAADTSADTADTAQGTGRDRDPGWDVVLDKGTFDAVSLSGERDGRGRRVCEGYGERVLRLLRTGGVFLVTSCNWTEKELRDWFETKTPPTAAGERLRMAGRIQYPSFQFGGVQGQTISTLCFEKTAA
ncbi:hypothetical protein VTH06DRAFT_3477 [Thermothelomyces fergusii]